MSLWHGYLHIHNITHDWSTQQRTSVWSIMRGLGKQSGDRPELKNHVAYSNNNYGLVVEAEFDINDISSEVIYAAIGNVLSLSPEQVLDQSEYTIFGGKSVWEQSLCCITYYLRFNLSPGVVNSVVSEYV